MDWICTLHGRVRTADGRRHVVRRSFDAAGDVHASALACLRQRADRGAPWYGDSVRVVTPLGQTTTIYVPWPGEDE
jgi:hypothetical protein